MATTNPDAWIQRTNALAQKIRGRKVVLLATTGTMVQVSGRVWNQGRLTNGGRLSYVENYEVYGYTPPLPRKPTGKGKPFAKWVNQEHAARVKKAWKGADQRRIKGGWYATYLAMKKQQGRGNHPFELVGRLRKAYFGGGVKPTPQEVNPLRVQIVLRGEEAQKFEGLTETKGPFLKLTAQERSAHVERIRSIYHEIIAAQ